LVAAIRKMPVARRFSGHFLRAILKKVKLQNKPLFAK
jgi:hypothetical protein